MAEKTPGNTLGKKLPELLQSDRATCSIQLSAMQSRGTMSHIAVS